MKRILNYLPSLQYQVTSQIHSAPRWSVELEHHELPDPGDIIHEDLIHQAIIETEDMAKDPIVVREILARAKDNALMKNLNDNDIPGEEFLMGLSMEDTATLLNVPVEDEELMGELYETALFIKSLIYGNRIVLFAPLYVSNYCIGSCVYCGYRAQNTEMKRKILTEQELVNEVKAIQRVGHKRIMMLCGEHPNHTFQDFLRYIEIAASVKTLPSGDIRRINVEIPQLSVSDLRTLKESGVVGTNVLFQETYHRETYEKLHPKPSGMKCDYSDRLLNHDRSMIAGLDDVGIGALFGLYDHRFEVLALLEHANHLDKTYGSGPHTISIPRMCQASGSEFSIAPPYQVSDEEFIKLVSIIRCAVPYTGMILTTRENREMRNELLNVGCSQMSAGSKTDIGSYKKGERTHKDDEEGQFSLGDHRPVEAVIQDLMKDNYIPSWCTACYRKNRTGARFMQIAKCGEIHNMCHPNALLTLQEYLLDYANEETRRIGQELIENEIYNVTSESRQKALIQALKRQNEGERDLHF